MLVHQSELKSDTNSMAAILQDLIGLVMTAHPVPNKIKYSPSQNHEREREREREWLIRS